MAFKKDGETKVFVPRKIGDKTASSEEPVRYTVDDLVRDSEKTEEASTVSSEENRKDVSN